MPRKRDLTFKNIRHHLCYNYITKILKNEFLENFQDFSKKGDSKNKISQRVKKGKLQG
jgi:hypothetical protein